MTLVDDVRLGLKAFLLSRPVARRYCIDAVLGTKSMLCAQDIYLSDLQLMEKLGVVTKGTLVAADNVIYPGAPGFLEYVEVSFSCPRPSRLNSGSCLVILDPRAFNRALAKCVVASWLPCSSSATAGQRRALYHAACGCKV